jgi:hypothetical protein
LGLPIPSKLKDLAARGGSFPSKGKYGLVSLSDDDNEGKVLVGPNFFSQGRLSSKASINSEDDNDQDDYEEERESSLRGESDESKDSFSKNDNDRQVEPVDQSESPYGFEYGKQPQFPPTYEGLYNLLPNPYLPPFNFNIPLPLINQYLQRRAYNRYPSQQSFDASQYPGVYGQSQYANSPSFTPYSRYFFVQ